ncbi:hypothetical protein CDAR_567801 [Caerostris darwini]|uniref:Uncharacterized protein n=1 Tax=Caerostris darwini TaxID=1538125 RepID=A0AAV4RQ73_9ARAC|nr:hypothetical protein CDAR_567801 [Caerostris darwini]
MVIQPHKDQDEGGKEKKFFLRVGRQGHKSLADSVTYRHPEIQVQEHGMRHGLSRPSDTFHGSQGFSDGPPLGFSAGPSSKFTVIAQERTVKGLGICAHAKQKGGGGAASLSRPIKNACWALSFYGVDMIPNL